MMLLLHYRCRWKGNFALPLRSTFPRTFWKNACTVSKRHRWKILLSSILRRPRKSDWKLWRMLQKNYRGNAARLFCFVWTPQRKLQKSWTRLVRLLQNLRRVYYRPDSFYWTYNWRPHNHKSRWIYLRCVHDRFSRSPAPCFSKKSRRRNYKQSRHSNLSKHNDNRRRKVCIPIV